MQDALYYSVKSHLKMYKLFPHCSKSAQDFGKGWSTVTQGLIQISIAITASTGGGWWVPMLRTLLNKMTLVSGNLLNNDFYKKHHPTTYSSVYVTVVS